MTLPRLLVTGGTGLVGSALVARAGAFEVHATRHVTPPPGALGAAAAWHPLDVRDEGAVRALVADVAPAVVVHAALDVTDAAALRAVCVDGAAHVAAAAQAAGSALLHLSSDMVFAGEDVDYDEDDAPAPVGPYGRAKADAEAAVRAAHPGSVIARLPLLYRLDPPDRALAAWLDAARRGAAHPLFVDEIRCPAPADDVAESLVRIAAALAAGRALPPVLHLPGPVALSRHAFGTGVLEALGLPAEWAAPGRAADSPVPRPRRLVFVARATPREFVEGLRSPAEAFSDAMPPTRPAGR